MAGTFREFPKKRPCQIPGFPLRHSNGADLSLIDLCELTQEAAHQMFFRQTPAACNHLRRLIADVRGIGGFTRRRHSWVRFRVTLRGRAVIIKVQPSDLADQVNGASPDIRQDRRSCRKWHALLLRFAARGFCRPQGAQQCDPTSLPKFPGGAGSRELQRHALPGRCPARPHRLSSRKVRVVPSPNHWDQAIVTNSAGKRWTVTFWPLFMEIGLRRSARSRPDRQAASRNHAPASRGERPCRKSQS